MEEIVKTEEGQRFFNFLDNNWGAIKAYNTYHNITDAIRKTIDIEGECFDAGDMQDGEYDNIIHYFVNMGSSY